MYTYHWRHYDQLSKEELHQILILRQQVFVVEQECAYLDADEHDHQSFHLFATSDNKPELQIAAYLRVITPTNGSEDYAIGRVLTRKSERKKGLANNIMEKAFEFIAEEFSSVTIKISAQLYLQNFYTRLGFTTTSEPYDEDGIPHIAMVKK